MTEEKIRTIDVLVPVYNPDEKLGRLIHMLNRQSRKVDKIVLMITVPDNSSEEEEGKKLSRWIMDSQIMVECHFILKAEFDHGGTRNKGMGFCTSELVICMTQDAVPEDDHMVEELTDPFKADFEGAKDGRLGNSEIIISYGRQMPEKGCRPAEAYTRFFNYPSESRIKTKEDIPSLGIKTFFASNVCAAYRRDLFLKQGGFPEKTIFNEDMIFAGGAVKAGYAIAYAAGARVIHSHNLSNKIQFQRNFDLAVSQTDYPDVFGGIRSEGEGVRLVKNTMKYLAGSGKFYLIPGLILTTVCKYTGYLLGRRYKRLPRKIVLACSMNKQYWGNKGYEKC